MAVVQLIPEGDLALENGDFVMIDGSGMVRQTILSRFRFFLGEWFPDLREGFYYRDILIKDPDLSVVRSVFRHLLTSTPGVLSIERFDLPVDAERHYERLESLWTEIARLEGGCRRVRALLRGSMQRRVVLACGVVVDGDHEGARGSPC